MHRYCMGGYQPPNPGRITNRVRWTVKRPVTTKSFPWGKVLAVAFHWYRSIALYRKRCESGGEQGTDGVPKWFEGRAAFHFLERGSIAGCEKNALGVCENRMRILKKCARHVEQWFHSENGCENKQKRDEKKSRCTVNWRTNGNRSRKFNRGLIYRLGCGKIFVNHLK